MRICTIIARSYLAQARVLALSYSEHNRGEPCSALLLDDPDHNVADGSEPFEVLRPEQLGVARFDAMAAMYDVRELAAAVKPLLLRNLLERDREPLAYFDPDILFFDEIDEIEHLAREEKLVLTPHAACKPIPPDGCEPSERTMLASGIYNLGFIALAPGPTAERLISWWSERPPFGSASENGRDLLLDQRRFDLVASVVTRFKVLRDPGANVAYWNLHERELRRESDRYTVNGRPLRFFHFSGFDPARPFTLSKHQSRFRLADEPLLAGVCEDYAAELCAQGFVPARAQRWRYGRLHDGTSLTPLLRRLYADGERVGAFRRSPFTELGAEEFITWCHEPAEVGGRHGLTRLCLAIYHTRPDLRRAFPDLDGDDGPGLLAWTHRHGPKETGLAPRWLPPIPDLGESEPSNKDDAVWGVNVAGYLRSELGVGEVARAVIEALDARSVPLMPIHGKLIPHSRQGHPFAFLDPGAAPFPVNLICVNADHLASFLTDAGREFSSNRYNIGFWWWEVPEFPKHSLEAFELVDEVWVGTEYVADALRPVSPVPIVKVRIPVTMPPIVPYSRSELGLPDGFLFLSMFDFHSVFERKDPITLIDAFRTAFDPGAGASLVIKCINHDSDPDNYDRLRLAAQAHPDIHIVEHYVSVERKDAMLATCDCYVSLHRAEGFGLPLAEAMCLGKPVIATRYSGNLDFMTDANSYLVDYELQPVGEGNLPYPAHATWAAADQMHAARLMRQVFEQPLEAEGRGRNGAADLRRAHSPDAAGETMERRLAMIRARLAQRRPVRHTSTCAETPSELTRLQELIDHPPVPQQAAPGGPIRRLARRAALRVMRPVTEYQRQLSEHGRKVGEALVAELDRQIATHADDVRRTRHRGGAQVAALLAELRSREAELASILAKLAALRAESVRRQERAGPDPAASSPAPGRDAADKKSAIVSPARARHADHTRNPPPTR